VHAESAVTVRSEPATRFDTIIVGAGAAGLATAIFLRGRNPAQTVLLLDGTRKPGAKILVSGGSRCNVTNRAVTERDFWGGPAPAIRQILRAFPARAAADYFHSLGVALHEEHDGKLFPDSNRSRDVLDALLAEADRRSVDLRGSHRVSAVVKSDDGFEVVTSQATFHAARVVLATGGQSLPKSGSDGAGYAMARALGHSIVPTTPALVPLTLASDDPSAIHAAISGVSTETALTLWIQERAAFGVRGALLWTHFGISGPVVLNMSRHWLRATLEGHDVRLTASFVPDWDFRATEEFLLAEVRERPRSTAGSAVARVVPGSMATALLTAIGIDPSRALAHLDRDSRRRLTRALTAWDLRVTGSRGYAYAEATAGGVDLREIDPRTLASRTCPGLYLVGEVLDVDGRLGGFNFQWAWATAFVAARALADGGPKGR
jgi:predicted Rossmann fold flavoprotein